MRQVRATCRQIKCKKGRDFFDATYTHGFVPLLPSKHHLYEAMPMRSASTAHYTTIRRPTQQSLRDPAYAAQTMTVSCDFYLPSTATKRQSSHSDAKCTPGSPNTMAQRAESVCQKTPPRSAGKGTTRAPNPFLDVQSSFRVAGTRDCALSQK